jgi:uncharacterized protein (DUF488 family)
MTEPIYTIGHSTHPIEKFIDLLRRQAIDVVCDVRSRPYSRANPQFNQEALALSLREAGIKYLFLGRELGARTDDETCYHEGQVQYERLAQTTLFRKGISRLKDGAQKFRIVLMCAEKEPLDCHRTILVARVASDEGLGVRHILSDGGIEDHEQAIDRLVRILKLPTDDMFRDRRTTIREAYVQRGHQIAYQRSAPGEHGSDKWAQSYPWSRAVK